MRYLVFIILGALLGQGTFAQERPEWTKQTTFEDCSNSYIEVVSATGYSETNARENARKEIVKRRSMASGADINVIWKGDDVTVKGSHDLIIKARVIANYPEQIEPGSWRVYLLVQTLKNPELTYENVRVTRQYSFSPRVFIPGMAQLHKGSTTKGVLFIAGEVAAIGGIVAFESLRSSYESKINSTHNAKDRQNYISKADNMENLRNGFIAGAAAIYLWNIIDGIAAKGKQHIVIGQSQLRITPYALPQAAGVRLCLKF